MKIVSENTRKSSVMLMLMFLAACSAADQSEKNTTAQSPAVATTTETVSELELTLSNTPLNQDEFLGLVAPKTTAVGPCPFLSDATARATAKTNWTLERRKTSNEQCYWSKNTGFSVKVTVEALATAKPVEQRVYNIDSPPLLKQQPGPGNNAVVLYDTTWDKEQAYAMAFELDNNLIMIKVTGMNTDADRLTKTANEVANRLASGLAAETQSVDPAGAYDMCSTWSQAEIGAIIGEPLKVTPRTLDCKWETGSGDTLKLIQLTIYSGKSYPWDAVMEYRGSKKVEGIGERGIIEKKRKRANMPGHILLNTLYKEKIVTVTTTDNIMNYESVAMALAKNIDERFK